MSVKKYDCKRIEQGGKNKFEEIKNIAQKAYDLKENFPEITTAKVITIALGDYPPIEENVVKFETGSPSEIIDNKRNNGEKI